MQVYLVGGAVRDELLGYPTREYDYVVVGASPAEMVAQGFLPIGQDFPVFLHPKTKDEYALARTERKSGHGYLGFTFNAHPDVTLEQDLIRRDLTINAIAKSTEGEIIDPFHGREDIASRCLRHVSIAFKEDPVRILRVARFAARYHHLGFTVAEETMDLMKSMVAEGEVDHLVAERVWKEFSRALEERSPEIFLLTLEQCGALNVISPELHRLLEPQHPEHTFNELPSIRALRFAAEHDASPLLRFACLTHDAKQQRWPQFASLSLPKEYRELAQLVGEHFEQCDKVFSQSAADTMQLLTQADAFRKPERFEHFLQACEHYYLANGRPSVHSPSSTPYPQKTFLSRCLIATKEVKAAQFIHQGMSGKDLGQAIERQRTEVIDKLYANQ